MDKDKIQEMIKRYRLEVVVIDGVEYIQCNDTERLKRDNAEAEIKASKEEIKVYIKEKKEQSKREYEERKRKISEIEGLDEIKKLITEWDRYNAAFRRMIERGTGYVEVSAPTTTVQEMREKYKRADAYLRAEAEAFKDNFELAEIGRKALERIMDGEDYEKVMADMEKDKKLFVEKHIWD